MSLAHLNPLLHVAEIPLKNSDISQILSTQTELLTAAFLQSTISILKRKLTIAHGSTQGAQIIGT
jgi:hypothetical protein